MVVRNAKKWGLNPKLDLDLLKIVHKFEQEVCGWKVVWARDPYLLASLDLDRKLLTMSIGWVVFSSSDSDRRRLAYLSAILRQLRKIIQKQESNHAPVSSCSSFLYDGKWAGSSPVGHNIEIPFSPFTRFDYGLGFNFKYGIIGLRK
jgi:hypothetical protein